jgi:hypothetical protein
MTSLRRGNPSFQKRLYQSEKSVLSFRALSFASANSTVSSLSNICFGFHPGGTALAELRGAFTGRSTG